MYRNIVLLILLVFLSQIVAACASQSPSDPAEVVQAFYAALNDGDLEAAMSFVSDEVQCRGHCYTNGQEPFRALIQENIAHEDVFEISDLQVEGDTVTFDYLITRGASVFARGVDSVMRVEAGKIAYFEIR